MNRVTNSISFSKRVWHHLDKRRIKLIKDAGSSMSDFVALSKLVALPKSGRFSISETMSRRMWQASSLVMHVCSLIITPMLLGVVDRMVRSQLQRRSRDKEIANGGVLWHTKNRSVSQDKLQLQTEQANTNQRFIKLFRSWEVASAFYLAGEIKFYNPN